MTRKISEAGRKFIEKEEGLRLQSYKDSVGIWTVGYGSTIGVQPGMTITQEQAEEMLEQDLATAEAGVESLVKVPINDNEFAALVSFAFNLGVGSLQRSTLLRCLNKGNRKDAAAEFLKWSRAGGVVSDAILGRRKREAALFLSK